MCMKTLIAVLLIALSWPASAQYKCTINGKSVYSDEPCAHNAQYVARPHDRVTTDQQVQRLQQSIKERRQRNQIERREAVEFAERDAKYQQNIEAERAATRARQARCADLQRALTRDNRAVALYQDVGFQRSLTQREAERKANQDRYDRECR